MEISIKLTEQECAHLKGMLEMVKRECIPNTAESEQVRDSIYRKLLFEMSKIQCPYCESYNFALEKEEKLRKCLECGNEFECG